MIKFIHILVNALGKETGGELLVSCNFIFKKKFSDTETQKEPTMTLSQIHTFLTVTQTLNFSQAAKVLGVTQPAVSTQNQLLEEEFGIKLFNRVGRRVFLSPNGILFLDHAKSIWDQVKNTSRIMTEKMTPIKIESLSLGIGFATGFTRNTPFTSFIRGTYKNATVSIHQGLDQDMLSELSSGKTDIVLTHVPDAPLVKNSLNHLSIHPVGSPSNLLVLASPTVAREKWQRDVSTLRAFPLILPNKKNLLRDFIEHEAQKNAIPLNITMETTDTDLILKIVMTGVGITILPASAAKNELESGTIIGLSLPDFLANSSLCAITRQEGPEEPSPLVKLGTRIFTSGWMEKS